MTVWDYLDKHEIIGTFVVCFTIYWLVVAVVEVARAFGRRTS